ncbi:Pyridoxal-dependent decarboxylase domain-containing protein 1 [Merluccius polli]|uniref:Pyridoxal-dependent decarboxylase domain-containing protein 1 n=1 Tax=Merluccius polli TaxID=89951 RepID=A0AA47MG19_MERPO|nr:Pyridoxal-dependent decarboxylase domain-containing protein 1 [Merluccius polli]
MIAHAPQVCSPTQPESNQCDSGQRVSSGVGDRVPKQNQLPRTPAGRVRNTIDCLCYPLDVLHIGQNVANIFHLVQDLMCADTDENDEQNHKLQNMGKQGHMALLGHCLTAYLSVLSKDRFRKLTTRILSDTTLWLCRLFRYENSSAFFHEDDREGLVRVCRLVLHTLYEDYASEGYAAFSSAQPIVYQSASSRPGLGQHICNQLGLPLSSLCTVPCNTVFGSQHQMDVAFLEKLIKEDMDAGKLPLLLIANAGHFSVDRAYRLGRLKVLCEQYSMWLHVEGVSLATLALDHVSSSVKRAINCDSMTLTLGPWLGLPAVPAITLYRHEDPALSLAAGLTSSQPVEKLRPLPLWLSLQYLGNDGIVQKIRHATDLVSSKHNVTQRLLSFGTKTLIGDLCLNKAVWRIFSREGILHLSLVWLSLIVS